MKLTRIQGRITVTVEYENSENIAASTSSIRPLLLDDSTYDEAALGEYQEFVINVLEIFDAYDFVCIEENESSYSKSCYYGFVKSEDHANADYKYILFVRISDHELPATRIKHQKHYYEEHASALKKPEPESKAKQRWKLKRITVNNDIYFSYDDALADVENRVASLRS